MVAQDNVFVIMPLALCSPVSLRPDFAYIKGARANITEVNFCKLQQEDL